MVMIGQTWPLSHCLHSDRIYSTAAQHSTIVSGLLPHPPSLVSMFIISVQQVPFCMGAHGWVARICSHGSSLIYKLAANSGSSLLDFWSTQAPFSDGAINKNNC